MLGDLNSDGIDDVALVLRGADSECIIENGGLRESRLNTNPRILAVGLAKPEGGYRLALANHSLIPRMVDPVLDDPLLNGGVTIRQGSLRVRLGYWASAGSYWMANTTYTFRLKPNGWQMIGYNQLANGRVTAESFETSINYLTRKAKLTTGYIDQERGWPERETFNGKGVVWKDLPPGDLLTIEQVGDGFAFDPGL